MSLEYFCQVVVCRGWCGVVWCGCLWCFFVLETIRTGAMRVIHVIVKTEETQKLRMKFVRTVLHYLNFKHKQNLPFHLSTGRYIWQQVDISTLGLEAWGLRCRRTLSLSCSRHPKSETKQNSTSHNPCMDLAIPNHSLLVHSMSRRSKPQRHQRLPS